MFSKFARLVFILGTLVGVLSDAAAQAAGGGDACARDAALMPASPQSAAIASLDRANQLVKNGSTKEAIEAFTKSERLALETGDLRTALFAAANSARAALEVAPPASIRERLVQIERRYREKSAPPRSLPDANSPPFPIGAQSAQLLIHMARTWTSLSSPLGTNADNASERKFSAGRIRAVDLLREAEQLADQTSDPRIASFALGYQAEIYFATGRANEALTLVRRALIRADKADAPDSLFRWYALLGRIHLESSDQPAALRAYRNAVKALDQLSLESSPRDVRFDESLASHRESIYLQLVELLLEKARRDATTANRQVLLAEARDTLESFKTEELRAYFEDACLAAQRKVTPDDIPGTVVLYPVVLPSRVALILSVGQELSLHDVPLSREDLDSAVYAFRRGLPNRMTRGYLRASSTLYEAIIRPIESNLDAAKTLVVIPGGALRSIPFAALYDAREEEFLIEKIAIASAPGLTLTDPKPLSIESTRALVAGISQSVQGYPALESVPTEIAGVSETFRSDVLLDEAFQTPRFEQLIEKRLIGVVHIASHGEFLPDFSKSFILTHDGKLSMERLARTIGRTRFRTDEPLELLVLSACETAAGDERAALGLAGVALQAGARSAVATLWSVNDLAAGDIVRRFYSALAAGHSRAEALRMAQRAMIADPDFSHAANWAPFLLISSWL